jgi:hypothetical protein
MAKDKKTVLLYIDLIHTIEKLSNEDAGLYFKHFLRYVNDLKPIPPSLLIDIVFEPHKQQLKRDLIKYDGFCNKQKNNGLKGGRPKSQTKPKNPSLFLETQKSLTDTDTDTDTVKEKEEIVKEKIAISIEMRQSNFYKSISFFVSEYPKDTLRDFYEYWSEKSRGGAKMRYELEKTWELSKRLKKWKQNEEKFKTTEKIVKSNQTKTLNGKPFDRMNYTSFSQ